MQNLDKLSNALNEVQKKTIGLFKRDLFETDYLPVVEEDKDTVTCVEIGRLLELQTRRMGKIHGNYVKFPDSKTLADMMEDPLDFHNWWHQNCKHSEL